MKGTGYCSNLRISRRGGISVNIMRQYHRVKYCNTRTGPQMISWDITNRCNLNCLHCLNRSGDSKVHDFSNELSRKKQLELAHQIVDLRSEQCCLCGGETLMNPNIFDIVKILSDGGILVNMVSNGLLLNESVIEKLKDAGIHGIQISIDGLGYQHDIFRNKTGAFEMAVNAAKLVVSHGLHSMVSFCPNKLNYRDFPMYVSYIRDLGVKQIRSMPFLPIGRGKTEGAHLLLTSNELFEFVNMLNKLKWKYKDIIIEWGDPLEHLMLILMNKRKYPVIMGISSVGDLTVTPYIPITVGNVEQNSLKDAWDAGYGCIWKNKKLIDIISNIDNIYDLGKIGSTPYKLEVV